MLTTLALIALLTPTPDHHVQAPKLSFTWPDLAPITRTDAQQVLYLVKTVRIAPEDAGGLGGAVVMIHDRAAHMGTVQYLAFKCADHTFSVDLEGKVANAGPGKFAVVGLRQTKGRDAALTPTSEFPEIAQVEAFACTGKLPGAVS